MLQVAGAHAVTRLAGDTVHLSPLFSGHAAEHYAGDHVALVAVMTSLSLLTHLSTGSLQSGAHRLKEIGSTNAGFEMAAVLRGDFRRTQL